MHIVKLQFAGLTFGSLRKRPLGAARDAGTACLELTQGGSSQGSLPGNAKLRGCDLVKLRVRDVAPGGSLRQRGAVIQQKTGRPVPFEITDPTREALASLLAIRGQRGDDWLFPSRCRRGEHVSTRQYARLVHQWVAMVDLEPRAFGTRSLRRTKVALLYKKTGNLRACQLLLGHRKLESTVQYLGIEVDGALLLSEQVEL